MIQNFTLTLQQDITAMHTSCRQGIDTSEQKLCITLSAVRILAALGIVFGGTLIAKGWKHDSVCLMLGGVATSVLCRDAFVVARNATWNMGCIGYVWLGAQTFFQNVQGAFWGTRTNHQLLTNGTICRLFWDKIVHWGR